MRENEFTRVLTTDPSDGEADRLYGRVNDGTLSMVGSHNMGQLDASIVAGKPNHMCPFDNSEAERRRDPETKFVVACTKMGLRFDNDSLAFVVPDSPDNPTPMLRDQLANDTSPTRKRGRIPLFTVPRLRVGSVYNVSNLTGSGIAARRLPGR